MDLQNSPARALTCGPDYEMTAPWGSATIATLEFPAVGTEGIGVRFIGVSLFVCGDVETFHHDAGFLAAGVGVAQFGGDAPFLAGHQGDVAIAVDGGEDAVAG